jgi:5-formyltetrahydrofolate cyclo-ligase
MVTTVHERQVVGTGRIPETDHDFRLHLIVTPERVIKCPQARRGPSAPGVRWDELTEEKINAIPVLRRLQR